MTIDRDALIAALHTIEPLTFGQSRLKRGNVQLWYGQGFFEPGKVLLWIGEESVELTIEEAVDRFLKEISHE